MNQNIGEAAIPQQAVQQVAPDVASPQGQQQMFQKAVDANKAKPMFDALLKQVAGKIGGESQVRVKQIETMASKIAQKRLQGREYDLEDINDALGGRIIVKNNSQVNKAKQAIEQLAKQGAFAINKAEPVKTDSYKAFHFDLTLPQGLDAEIQIHDQHTAAESVINHDIRAVNGEKPANDAVARLRDKQAAIIKDLPGEKALAISKVIQGLRQQNNNQPIHPAITAGILASA